MFHTGKIPRKTVYDVGFKRPQRFYPKNREQNGTTWNNVENVILHEKDAQNKSQSRIRILYPNMPGRPEFCHEEFRAYQWFRSKKVQNNFVTRCSGFWETEMPQEGAGCLPPTHNRQQKRKTVQEMPVSVMEFHDKENAPFRKPSPRPASKGRMTEVLQQNRSPLASIGNNIRNHRKTSTFLSVNEALESLSIHKGPNFSISSESEAECDINPFSSELKRNFLIQMGFVNRLKQLPTCSFRDKVRPLGKGVTFEIGGEKFNVIKSLAKGGYGTIFTAKGKNNKIYALKQEKPQNLWEYYLCLEIHDRIKDPNMLPSFISVSHGLIGDNTSILAASYSRYGSLREISNAVITATGRCCDELIVMCMAKQIFSIIQHLHNVQIIHADVKPDNFLLINEIGPHPFIQLIDFGCSIDWKLIKAEFPQIKGFREPLEKNVCIEMREGRLWSFQLDWYGVAETLHAMLFGSYMQVKKEGHWKIATAIKRYLQKDIWENCFKELLNIMGEKPDVEKWMAIFEQQLKRKDTKNKITEFNSIVKRMK